MKLPNLSKAMDMGCWRYIQSIHEPPEHRNPDVLVRRFIPTLKRWRLAWLGREELCGLRANPFYYYLVARTRHYDQVLNEAVSDGVKQIALVGSGTDTRAYRFEELLCSNGVRVLECDQPEIIRAKQRTARRWRRRVHVDHLPLDLNENAWPDLKRWLGNGAATRTLVLMEGVSVYINEGNFSRFLHFLATQLSAGSHVAYDFKIQGVNDDLGRGGRIARPFRLPLAGDEVAAFHEARGLRLARMEQSSELTARLMPDLAESGVRLFQEDALVRLLVDRP